MNLDVLADGVWHTLKWGDDNRSEPPAMHFHLTYEGVLYGASRNQTRATHKHEVRKVFHEQLKRLWEISPPTQGRRRRQRTGRLRREAGSL
jgi:hypothetical protein